MRVSICYNDNKPNAILVARRSAEILEGLGAKTEIVEFNKFTADNTDVCIAVGGDGTIMHLAKKAAINKIAVLGINVGRVGVLAGLEEDELSLLKNLVLGKYKVEKRRLLKMKISGSETEYYSLNDFVIANGKISKLIDITVTLDGEKLSYRSDGIIFATPTGSTAYSMSAGGPIIAPTVNAIVVTPICPYTMFSKSLVVDGNAKITASAVSLTEDDVYITADGEIAVPLKSDDIVQISSSDNMCIDLIKITNDSFLDAISNKIM